MDLSPVDDLMRDRYSVFGPEPRLPSSMLRSYLLSIKCKVTSITAWASDLKQNHLHAILSGFSVGDTPGTGTFYDFFDPLWLSDSDNISNPVHPPRQKSSTQPHACLRFSNPSFWMFPSTRGLSTWITWLFPVTERLSIPVPGSVRPAPAAVWKRASGTVSATVSTTSLTATPAGIPTGNGITLVTAFTRSLPLTPKMTCRYSPCSALPPDMIPMAFGITSSP